MIERGRGLMFGRFRRDRSIVSVEVGERVQVERWVNW